MHIKNENITFNHKSRGYTVRGIIHLQLFTLKVAHDTNIVYEIMRIKTLALLAILFMGLSFVSCSSDDNDDDGGNNTEIVESIVGTWKWNDGEVYQLITFKSNGKGTMKEVDEDGEYEESFSYSYNASKKVLKINWDDDDPEEWTVTSLTSKKLVVKDGEGNKLTLTKQ